MLRTNQLMEMHTCTNLSFLQRGLARRAREDEKYPASKWGKDRTVSDQADRDPEIPTPSGVQYRGKTPVPPPVQILSDDDSSDEDCRPLEVIEATPLRYSYPASTQPAASGAPAGGAEPKASGSSRPAGASRTKRVAGRGPRKPPAAKRQKVGSTGPPRRRPTFAG